MIYATIQLSQRSTSIIRRTATIMIAMTQQQTQATSQMTMAARMN